MGTRCVYRRVRIEVDIRDGQLLATFMVHVVRLIGLVVSRPILISPLADWRV